MSKTEALIIELDSVNSTNNYAMMVAESGEAQHGMTITAKSQTEGRGQRGASWDGEHGSNLLMSVIIMPGRPVSSQFVFNCAVAVAVADALAEIGVNGELAIKWPNDIFINDKKAGGILIENLLRGSFWSYAIIGLGLNVNQNVFPTHLPHATSLQLETGKIFSVSVLRDSIIHHFLHDLNPLTPEQVIMSRYNGLLYKRGQRQAFMSANGLLTLTIMRVNTDGTLEVHLPDGNTKNFRHGEITWVYDR